MSEHVGLLKRRKAKSYELIQSEQMLLPNELYYLYFRHTAQESAEKGIKIN